MEQKGIDDQINDFISNIYYFITSLHDYFNFKPPLTMGQLPIFPD